MFARVFPRLRRLHVFASSSVWFIGLSVSVVIGQSDSQMKSDIQLKLSYLNCLVQPVPCVL